MAVPDIDTILTPMTAVQIRAKMVTLLIALSIPADKWAPGGVASSILTVAANILASLSTFLANGIAAFFLPKASGGFLLLLANYVYGVTVPDAVPASGNETLTNASGSIYTVAAFALTFTNAVTGQTYQNTTGFTLNPSSSISIPIAAVSPGSIGNANPGDISILTTGLLGVTVTNSTSLVGIDAPTDPAIRQLCLNSLAARSIRGPRGAYAYAVSVATNSVTGNPVNVNRVSISQDGHTGVVSVVVAGPSGTTDPNDVTGIATSIEANARPDGVTVNLTAATTVAYTRTISSYVMAPVGTDMVAVQAAMATAITGYIQNFKIGGVVAGDDTFPNGFQGLLGGGIIGATAQGVATFPGAILASVIGATDLPLTSGQVATNNVTVNLPVLIPTGAPSA